MSTILLYIPVVVALTKASTIFNTLTRWSRHCHKAEPIQIPGVMPVEESNATLLFIFLSVFILFLVFLGILPVEKVKIYTVCVLGLIKGLLGLFVWNKLGSYGLDLLVELPRPLSEYQETALKGQPVVYDVAGWPVHPNTLKKTVKVLPK